MIKETWKKVKEFEKCYEISNYGNLRSLDRYSKIYLKNKRHFVLGIIRKPSIKNGYYFCWIQNEKGKKYMQYIHRLVAENFLEKDEKQKIELYIDHIDRNRLNNFVGNLRWCTPSKNLLNNDKSKGYYYHRKNKCYYTRIKYQGKVINLGRFATPTEAKKAYSEYKKKFIEMVI